MTYTIKEALTAARNYLTNWSWWHRSALFLLGLVLIHYFVRAVGQSLAIFLSRAYDSAIFVPFQLYALLFYTLVLWFTSPFFKRASLNLGRWANVYLGIFLFYFVLRIFSFGYTAEFNHGDFSYFADRANPFHDAISAIYLNSDYSFETLLRTFNKLTDVYPLPLVLMPVLGEVARFLLAGTAPFAESLYAMKGFSLYGLFFAPLYGFFFLGTIALILKSYVLDSRASPYWTAIFVFILSLLPAHIFMASTISYNFIAEGFIVLTILANLGFVNAWIKLVEHWHRNDQVDTAILRKFVFGAAVTAAAFTGLIFTKVIFIPVLLTLIIQTLILSISAFFAQRRIARAAMGILLPTVGAILLVPVGIYFAYMFLYIVYFPAQTVDMWRELVMLGRLTEVMPLWLRVQLLHEASIVPNIRYVGYVTGTIGFCWYFFESLKVRSIQRIVLSLWVLLTFTQSIISWATTTDYGSMTRNLLLMALYVMFSVFFFYRLSLARPSLARLKYWKPLVGILLSFEVASASTAALIFFATPLPFKLENYLRENPVEKVVTFSSGFQCYMYGFWCRSSEKTRSRLNADGSIVRSLPESFKMSDFSLRFGDATKEKLLENDRQLMKSITAESDAQIWLVHFHIREPELSRFFASALESSGYRKIVFKAELPYTGSSILNEWYDYHIEKLFANLNVAGLWAPSYIELFQKP